jgi:hypothetical protein
LRINALIDWIGDQRRAHIHQQARPAAAGRAASVRHELSDICRQPHCKPFIDAAELHQAHPIRAAIVATPVSSRRIPSASPISCKIAMAPGRPAVA